MRVLKFIVDGQSIKKDPKCDFTGLVAGTEGYLQLDFSFSPEWMNCVKVVSFWSITGKELPPQILKDGKTCMIPVEALTKRRFGVQVVGKKDKLKLITNKEFVYQKGGK